MLKLLVAFVLAACFLPVSAQTDTLTNLNDVVVYSFKFAERKKNLVQKIDIISSENIARFNAQNSGDLLLQTGNVFVQKSQQGGSSPVLRGFEASRVLIVIDNVRHNNAIFRAGHLQNLITVDQNMLEQAEIIYGPGSTLYGSDALGGVVHLRTKAPKLSKDSNLFISGSAFTRYSTANDEKTIHADISLGKKRLAWLSSFTFSDFGDMKMGSNYPDSYPGFGSRDSLIVRFGFRDSVIENPHPLVQRYSGYKQWDAAQKLLFAPSDKINHSLNFQYSTTTNIPRYDRLQDKRAFGASIGTTLRFAEWFYGPQERFLAAYELSAKSSGFFQAIKLNLNYQSFSESRQQREYRRYDRFDSRRENVEVYGFVADAKKFFGNNELIFGADGQLNKVHSEADRTNLTTGAVTKLDTRYPDGNNRMNYFGVYAQHLLKLDDAKWVLNDGLRVQLVSLRSSVIDNSFFNLPVTRFEQNSPAITGNIGLIYNASAKTRVSLGGSSGFRAPNIDDLVKVFDFSVASRVYVPNAGLKPEYTYNVDLSIDQKIGTSVRVDLSGFYTSFRNAIVGAPFTLNGADSLLYNGVMSAVYANQNLNKGRTYGGNVQVHLNFARGFYGMSTANFTRGRLKKFGTGDLPQDHIPPFFGKTAIEYRSKSFTAEVYAHYNGFKKIKDYNPDGEDNQQYATPDGMPGWVTLNWRSSVTLAKAFRIQLGVENILDRNYRYFASGFSAPGRNFIFALRSNF